MVITKTTQGNNNNSGNSSIQKDKNNAAKEAVLKQTKQFLYYMDHGKGWDACKAYCVRGGESENILFECQSDTLADIHTVEAYANWRKNFGQTISPDEFTIDVHSCSLCEETMTVTYVATYHGKHTGTGGPVQPPTNKELHTDYVYLVQLDEDEEDKVQSVTKIWNDGHAMKQLGWV